MGTLRDKYEKRLLLEESMRESLMMLGGNFEWDAQENVLYLRTSEGYYAVTISAQPINGRRMPHEIKRRFANKKRGL